METFVPMTSWTNPKIVRVSYCTSNSLGTTRLKWNKVQSLESQQGDTVISFHWFIWFWSLHLTTWWPLPWPVFWCCWAPPSTKYHPADCQSTQSVFAIDPCQVSAMLFCWHLHHLTKHLSYLQVPSVSERSLGRAVVAQVHLVSLWSQWLLSSRWARERKRGWAVCTWGTFWSFCQSLDHLLQSWCCLDSFSR